MQIGGVDNQKAARDVSPQTADVQVAQSFQDALKVFASRRIENAVIPPVPQEPAHRIESSLPRVMSGPWRS